MRGFVNQLVQILFVEYRFNIFKFISPVIQILSMPVSTTKPVEWSMLESTRGDEFGVYKMFLTITLFLILISIQTHSIFAAFTKDTSFNIN